VSGSAFGVGARLGHYVILGQIGAGGMGVVFRARDEKLRREVALKVLPGEEVADPVARARLVREARMASALSHPNICVIYDVGEDRGETYIAMELVDGQPLSRAIPPQGMTLGTVLRYGIQIADALAHAHGHGVVHRDLKSANVIATPEGRVKVLDFGLARQIATGTSSTIEVSARLTQAGAIVGTADYMAPEVLRGAVADERSDLWALGVLLHEMVGGSLPFSGQTHFEVAAAILSAEPDRLPESTPAGLRALIARCLRKDPGQRYQHAEEVRAALEALHADSTTPAAAPAPRIATGVARIPRLGLAIGAAAIVVVAGALVLREQRGRPAGATAIRSLAVLPLANLSGDPGQEYFADGMTDELINELARLSSLKVIARGSVMVYKDTHKPLRDIANELGVDAVVEGSVTRVGQRVRVRAELARGRTGESLWAESYERDLQDVLSLQTDLARAIVQRIQLRLAPQEKRRLAEKRAVDPDVYQAYLKGRYAWNRYTLEGFRQAQQQFESAIALDPTYAPAWAGLADAAYGMSSLYVAPAVALPQSRAAAERALSLDPNLSEAHTSLGIVKMVFDWDWKGALEQFERAIALEPSSASAHWWRGRALIAQGRFDEGLSAGRRALDLDLLSSWYSATHGWHLYFARRYKDAEKQLRAGLEIHPDEYVFHVFLGLVLEQQGDHGGAVRELEKAVSMDVNNDDLAQLAHAYGTAGRRADAERTIARLLARRRDGFVPAASLAMAYAGLKNEEETLRWLEAGVEDHSEMLVFIAVDPYYDWIRPHPRFQAVLRRLRLAG
jgi:TolB-like protein/Tfp pilus assembly protein PilF/tRNA A-37 threonylcarbamoyl transferase component Bud32